MLQEMNVLFESLESKGLNAHIVVPGLVYVHFEG